MSNNLDIIPMRLKRYFTTLLFAIVAVVAALAEEVIVTVTPMRPILPPQVMLYISNPGQYFSLSVQNTTDEVQNIYFGAEIRQLTPASDIEIIVPGKTMPRVPVEVPAGGSKMMTAAEMRTMFNHVQMSDVVMPQSIFESATSNSFGNLAEGEYEIVISAYKWDPSLKSPVLISNPTMSKALFRVCYQGNAPQWTSPVDMGDYGVGIASLSAQTPLFMWMAPVVNCSSQPRTFTYDLKIVQLMPLQSPEEAIERNPVVYQAPSLTMPQCMIPISVINNISPLETYVAQITAHSNATQVGALDYIELMNNGKSDLLLFKVKDYAGHEKEITKYSVPELISPVRTGGVSKFATLDPSMPVVEWTEPKRTGFMGRSVAFSYSIRIVEPTPEYENTTEGIRRALDELKPVFEIDRVRHLKYSLPDETVKKLDPSQKYLLEVIAHPDTTYGAYEQFEFADGGRSLPSIFACQTAFVSAPRFEVPKPFSQIDYYDGMDLSKVAERIYKDNATIKWTAPKVQGDLDPSMEFVYDLKIVKPTGDYDINKASMSRALDELDAVYEKTDITATSFTLPESAFSTLEQGQGYLMRVTARISGNKEKLGQVAIANDGKSEAAIVAFSQGSEPTTYGTAEFISPKPCTELFNERTAFMSINNPKFTWNEPEMTGEKAEAVKFTYNLKIVSPSDAEDEEEYEPTLDGAKKAIAELESLHEVSIAKSTSYTLPDSILKTMRKGAIYVARLRAVPDTASVGKNYKYKNYGFSIPTLFALTDADVEDLSDGNVIYDDSVYNFTTPEIISPRYDPDEGARKEFLGNDIEVEWRKPEYLGGGGVEPDTIQFAYDIELYSNKEYISRKEMLEKEPIYSIKDVKSIADTILWDKIESLVNKGDYMMLRIKPKAVNDTTVAFVGDSLNVIDFGMSELFTHRYFQCANQVDISNETPTSRTVDDLKGKSIRIGEYQLVLDGELKAIDDKPGHFKGNGHVIWEPLKLTWKLAVKFDDIAVNTDDQVYEGNVETWGGPENKMQSSEVVDKLFSDWGIDNIIGDTGLPYADKLQAMADGKAKGLAESLDIAQYYQDYIDGKAKVLGLLSGNVENVTFPLEIPESINPTPVNLTISKMKFAPTYATMDLFGTFVVPETEATKNQILVFGSPRMCISPQSLIPEGGTVALLKDFEVQEPKSGFKCKFKAPEDVMEPNNGCFVSWSNDKFEWLNLDIDMTMPDDLKKVDDNGKRTEENPKLHVTTQIQFWEDFIATASMDPFEHVDLPGYVFTAQDVVVDLASRKNHQDMAKFPEGYDYAKSGLNKAVLGEWEGLYMKELSMQFPSSIKLGNGSERMKVALTNAFIDKSGFTADCGIVNAINYSAGEEGTIGGFKFSLDHIYVSVIQNNFNKFGFDGKLAIPLFDGKIDYSCSIYNQTFTKKGTGKGYAYVFKTSQIEDLNFDFMLGDLTLTKELTYFLVEALPDEQGELKTNVELCVGGEVTIAGTEMVNKKAANLPFNLKLPNIKFCKMRIANNKSFESVYEREMQQASLDAIEEMMAQYDSSGALFSGKWNEEEDMQLGEDCWLNFGQWGAASPAKGIGPFKFALTDWDFEFRKNGKTAELGIKLGGDITFCDELSITAGTTLEFVSTLQNIDDLSNISIGFKEVKFHEARFGMENAAFKFKGVLSIDGEGGSAGGTDKGYKGLIDLSIAGGLFELKVQGGYYEHKEEDNNFSWGFFDVQAGGKCGLPIPPITLDNIHGGVYFNCQYNKDNPFAPKPKKGAIGIIFGMGISTIDKVTLSGNLEITVAYNYKIKKLTTFIFSGGVKAVGGIVNSTVKLVYEDNDTERYFQLNVTVDASLDGGINDLIGEWASSLEGDYMDPEAGFQGAMKDESAERGKGSDYEANMEKYDKKKNADTEKSEGVSAQGPGLKIQLDIRVGHKKTVTEGPDGNKVVTNGPNKWHVYLGEPEKSKRCQFILVDFKSKIVSVSVGADAYFCLGNELPGDGALPPIPEKIRKFLDGGSKGGVDSDDIKAAENARQKAKDLFFKNGASEVSGGVMLGASVWGYISVDLGLFYGDLGAEAGFDISVRNLGSKVMCVNLPGGPGRNGWYGEGQLYAYLYAKFGLRINLGFFKKKIDLIDAGIGGVLQCGMPNPNYFTGKARVKIRLLGGLVNLNKKFSFECGDKCQFFYGNALDDYKLFEKCNIGVDTPDEALSNPIDWERQSFPEVETQPILGNVIRVVDPTEKARLEADAQGKTDSNTDEGEESFDEWSSRSFKFIMTDVPVLTEYSTESDFKNDRNGKNMEVEHSQNGNKLKIKLTRFNPNRYYRLRMKGCSKEYHQMKWQDPWTFDTIAKKYYHTPWVQTKDFYFVTNNKERTFADDEDLQPHVAVAIPAFGVRLCSKNEKGELYSVNATMDDAQMPSISLFEPMKGKAYNKGTLKWYVWRDGQLQGTRNVAWFENDSVSVIMPSSKLPGMAYEKTSRVRLRYEWQEQVQSDATWVPINTYTVQGSSREEIQKKYAKDLIARYGSRASKYRVVVQQANYLNDETDEPDLPTSEQLSSQTTTARVGRQLTGLTSTSSSSSTTQEIDFHYGSSNTYGTQNNNLTFTVTIMQLKSGLVTVTHVKDLYEMDITPTYKDWTAEQLFAETSRPPLWQTLAGRKLNSLTSGSDHEWVDEDNTYLNALKTKTTKLPWTSYNNNRNERLVTQNPFFYLTYLAKAFFIGGVHWKPGYLEHEDISTRSLEITSPYGEWTNGILDHMLGNGYQEIRDMAVFSSKMAYGRYSSPYPLYTKNSSDDSEFPFKQNGFVTAHQLTEKDYAQVLADYYRICYELNQNIINYCGNLAPYIWKADRPTLKALFSQIKYRWKTFTGNSYNVEKHQYFPQVTFPVFQYYLVHNAAQRARLDIDDNIVEVKGKDKHPRISGASGVYVGRRIYFTAVEKIDWVDENLREGWEVVKFNPDVVAHYNNYIMNFTRYRVNAWNFKSNKKYYTVWVPVPTSPTSIFNHNSKYTYTYNKLFLDLVREYGLRIR